MTDTEAALFVELGPRGRRRMRIATAVSIVVLVGVVVGVLLQLQHVGQLSADLWSPLGQWPNIRYLLQGLLTTLEIGLAAAAMSMVLGTLAGLGRLSSRRWISWPCTAAIEFFRSIPLILLVYFFLLGLPIVGLRLPAFWTLCIPIVAHAGAVFAEIVRAGITSLDRGQTDAAAAIGMPPGQAMRLVVLPQVFRQLQPALVTQVIRTLKESSLGFVVSFPELLRNGQILGEYSQNFLQTYAVVALIYILINYGLSKVADLLRRPRTPRGGSAATSQQSGPAPVELPVPAAPALSATSVKES
jgi:glutamate transport system permease protein